MISTTRRSPNATLVTKTAVEQASQALQDLPEKPREKLSLREVVDALREHITAALDKGYSYEDITAMLAAQGVSIAPSSLKHYLARSNRQLKAKGTAPSGRRRQSVSKEAELIQAELAPQFEEQIELAQEQEAEPASRRGRRPAAETEAAPEEEAPKRGRRASSQSQDSAAKTRTTTRSTSRTKSGPRKRRSSAS
jgi:vacuolar-type H+-ATPase subunit E/Vma4